MPAAPLSSVSSANLLRGHMTCTWPSGRESCGERVSLRVLSEEQMAGAGCHLCRVRGVPGYSLSWIMHCFPRQEASLLPGSRKTKQLPPPPQQGPGAGPCLPVLPGGLCAGEWPRAAFHKVLAGWMPTDSSQHLTWATGPANADSLSHRRRRWPKSTAFSAASARLARQTPMG